MTLSPDHQRYLRLLEIDGIPTGLEGLRQVVRQHLTHVPFENVSKLYYHRRSGFQGIPDLPTFLDGIERSHLGGTCYANNSHLNTLLRALNFDADLCAADMSSPDVHITTIVRLDSREYLVDAGYGAPFLEPLPRDLDHDYQLTLGNDTYVLKPQDADGRSRLELHRTGKLSHAYVLKPSPRHIDEFRRVVEESFAPTATFMNALAIVRFSPGRSLVLNNLRLIESQGATTHIERIADPSQLPGVIQSRFGIPAAITREALRDRALSFDPWEDSATSRHSSAM